MDGEFEILGKRNGLQKEESKEHLTHYIDLEKAKYDGVRLNKLNPKELKRVENLIFLENANKRKKQSFKYR